MKQLYRNMLLVPVVSLLTVPALAADPARESTAPVSTITAEDIQRFSKRPIDELKTTARRTEENVLEVPVAITTLTAEQIEKGGIQGLFEVAQNTPGLSFFNFFGETLPRPVIRGVPPLDIFGEANTAVFVDGIYVSSGTGINVAFGEYERIEVLKGPQGAQFGNNAFSGAINYVTRRPADELFIKTELTAGTYNTQRALASIEGPLIADKLSGRVSLIYDDFGGAYDNQNPDSDQDIGGRKYKTVESVVFYTPTDDFAAQWNTYISDDSIDPPAASTVPAQCQGQLSDPNDPSSRNPNRKSSFCGELPGVGKNDLFTAGETGQTRQVFRTTLKMDLEREFGSFLSLTGYSKTRDQSFDSGNPGAPGTLFAYTTETGFPGPSPLAFLDSGGLVIPSVGKRENTDFSQELRFSSPQDNRLRYSVGAYYFTQETDTPSGWRDVIAQNDLPADFRSFCPLCISAGPAGFIEVAGAGNAVFGPWFSSLPNEQNAVSTFERDDWAVFGSIEYDITEKLTGYVDLRYTDTERTTTVVSRNPNYDFATDTVTFAAPTTDRLSNDTEYVTWRASLTYAPNDYTSIYGSIATGEKGGDVETFEVAGTGNMMLDGTFRQSTFDPEKNTTYELGYKTALNEGQTVIDMALYYIDWEDIVLRNLIDEIADPMNPGGTVNIQPVAISQNAGQADITGFEASIRSALTDNIDTGLGLSYNKAELDNATSETFSDFPAFAPDGDISGQTLPRQPELQLNANMTFRDQFVGDWEWFVRGDAFYQSRWYVSPANQAQIPSRVRANLRLGLESETYSVELWVRNLFDDDSIEAAYRDVYFSNANQDGTTTGSFDNFFPFRFTVTQAQRRVAGITFRGRFGG